MSPTKNMPADAARVMVPTASRALAGVCLALLLSGDGLFDGAEAQPMPNGAIQKVEMMKISITVEGKTVTAMLDSTPSAKAFAALLPLTLTLSDYGDIEKVSDLPAKLTTDGAPAGFKPSMGDIAYYAPWGNLAIFRKGFRYSEGLVRLGVVNAGGEALDRSGPLRATIALTDQ